MKLLWKILSEPENIWVNIIKSKYLKDHDLSDYVGIKKNKSWQWSQLIKLRPDFYKGTHWCVRNGENIRIWKDNWILGHEVKDLIKDYVDINNNDRVSSLITNQK